jgi:flagellar hook assembly protein FlgD
VLDVRVAPNPAVHATRISYSLESPARVRLTVHDVAGRTVDTLVDAQRPAGEHVESWTPSDDAGSRLPSGIYWLRLRANGSTTTSKLLVAR